MRAWRIAREPYALDRDGHGAKLNGGRWTPPGIAVLHAAQSIALAALEVLVHAPKPPPDLMLVAIDLPDTAPIDSPRLVDLPDDWANPLPSEDCKAWGKRWCDSREALALAVPSVIFPEERNFVINVSHSQMKGVRLRAIRRFTFDPRLRETH